MSQEATGRGRVGCPDSADGGSALPAAIPAAWEQPEPYSVIFAAGEILWVVNLVGWLRRE